MKGRLTVGLVVVAGVLSVCAAQASAALRLVDNTPASLCKSGYLGPYTTIQDAVDASGPNDTVTVCPGTYTEQVTITTPGLKLQSNTTYAAKIAVPAGLTGADAIVHVDGVPNVVVTKFMIAGPSPSGDPMGAGILVDGGATGARIVANRVLDIRQDPVITSFTGYGILFGAFDSPPPVGSGSGSGIAQDNEIAGTEFIGLFAGGAGSVVNATRNRVTGASYSQFGIVVYNGAKGTLLSNTVSGNARGGIVMEHAAAGTSATGNVASSNPLVNFWLDNQQGATLKSNTATGGAYGFFVQSGSANTLRNNRAWDNSFLDCADATTGGGTAGTATTWIGNRGALVFPAGICAP